MRPEPTRLSPAWEPGVRACPGGSFCLVRPPPHFWPWHPPRTKKLGCGWGSFLGEGQRGPAWAPGAAGPARVVFQTLAALPVLNWISGPSRA